MKLKQNFVEQRQWKKCDFFKADNFYKLDFDFLIISKKRFA